MKELLKEEMQAAKPQNWKRGFLYILFSLLLSLLLSLLVMSVLVILGPILSTVKIIEAAYFIVFVFGFISMALGISGFRFIKKASIPWAISILGAVSLLASTAVLFFALYGLFYGVPEVKGVVQKIGDDFIIIHVDEDYQEEYRTATFSNLPNDFSTGLITGISSQTIFFEQYGNWRWQREIVSLKSLKDGQHIQIKYNGTRFLTGSIVEAEEIIILNK